MKPNPGRSSSLILIGVVTVLISVMLVWIASRTRHRSGNAITESPSEGDFSAAETDAALSSPDQPALITGELPHVVPISLVKHLTAPENIAWSKDKTYELMPRGTQSFGGIEFWIDGVIQLRSGTPKSNGTNFRTRVTIPLADVLSAQNSPMPHGSNIACLYLVGAARNAVETDMKVADLIWRYTDGSSRRTPIHYLNQVRDYTRAPFEEPSRLPYQHSKVIWKTKHPSEAGSNLRLYRVGFANPFPAKAVKELEFTSALVRPRLFFLALTLDSVPLGARPDDFFDLEEVGDEPGNILQLTVVDQDERAISGAKVTVDVRHLVDSKTKNYQKTSTTDAFGNYRVPYPLQGVKRLEIAATHSDYSGRKMVWDCQAGDKIPAAYTLKLQEGITIGGFVVDESDSPISDVKLSFSRFWYGEDDMSKRGEQPDFPARKVTTDFQGHWSLKGLPPTLLDRIHCGVAHPDFVETNFTVGSSTAIEQQLRAGTFKIVLHGGLTVHGRVLDAQDNPVSGAKVWAGRKYTRERKQSETDTAGQFTFRSLNQGEILFSVMAERQSPTNSSINVQPGMGEIIFHLSEGALIRAHVQNEGGEALSGVSVGLEGRPGEPAYDAYEFSTKTDSEGNFQWSGAPNESMPFYFFLKGYESKRGLKLKPQEENTVTLRRSRHLQGLVLDATSDQPVTNFTVRTGRRPSEDSNQVYGVIRNQSFSAADGRFTLDLNEEDDNAVMIQAAGYTDQTQSFPEAQNGVVNVVVRMKPAETLNGIVLGPDGNPVPGASVAASDIGSPGSFIQLVNGRLRSFSRAKIVTTDSEGKFQLSSLPEKAGNIIAAADSGFAAVAIEQVRATGIIQLQAFGRIEGTFKLAGQPVAGQEFTYTLSNIGVSPNYRVSTDDAGHFQFDKVPAGEGQIARLVKTSQNSWSHSHNTTVMVEPGKTTQVTLGDTGAVLKGHVSFETTPENPEKLIISGNLSTAMPTPPQFANADEARAFVNTSEWKERVKQIKRFSVAVQPDGSFVLDSIPPGTYTLNVSASKSSFPGSPGWIPPVANGKATVVVPENTSPYSSITLDEIILKPVSQATGSRVDQTIRR